MPSTGVFTCMWHIPISFIGPSPEREVKMLATYRILLMSRVLCPVFPSGYAAAVWT